jgi:plasmid stabilization system protein ParE
VDGRLKNFLFFQAFCRAGRREAMPQGDKGKYTGKQKRKAGHIAEGYKKEGVSKREASARAWATVNKESGGGKKSGSGRGKTESHASSRKGGRKGGYSPKRTSESRSAAAKKGWETRRHKAHG